MLRAIEVSQDQDPPHSAMNQDRPSLSKRVRAILNVRVRLLLLFILLLGALAGMAQLFRMHISDNLQVEHDYEQAQDQLQVYADAQDAVMQYRIFLLRAVLFASVAPESPESLDPAPMQKLVQAQNQMKAKLDALAQVDARESAALRALLPDTLSLIPRIQELAQQGRREELALLIKPATAGFNQLHARLLESAQKTKALVGKNRSETHRQRLEKLQTSAYLMVTILLSAIILTYLALRNVLVSLSDMMRTLHSIPSKNSAEPKAAVTGDEFDQMRHALEQLRLSTGELNRFAYVHPLTGLPNSVRMTLELERVLAEARQMKVGVALLFVDLNDFRAINDAIGHDTGDACLREMGKRLQALTAPREAVFHFSGDLFALYLQAPSEDLPELVHALAQRIHQAVLQPVQAVGRSLRLTASVGVAHFPEHADDARGLISAADAAMHQAKRQGRDNTQIASRELATRADANLKLTADIQRGMAAAEFIPLYEPIIDMEQDRVVGAEALLRWKHPTEGLLRPGRFIEVAEQTGQLHPMTGAAFRTSCTQFAQWPDGPYLTFNVSPKQIRPALASVVQHILQETGMPADRLELEITESALVDRVEQAAQILSELRDLGVRLSLDDFGTGYSSLSYLQRLPVTKLKIDRSFVCNLETSRASQAIVNAMLGIARNLHLEVVAEGVETPNQLEILRAMGCRYMQGYLFSTAMSAEQLATWMQTSPSIHLSRPQAA